MQTKAVIRAAINVQKAHADWTLLPQAAPDNRAMMAYLKGRGIDQEILDYCVQTGRIYESRNKGHSNVVFVGFDKDGKARFGCLRGISEARFHGDLSGSDKHLSLIHI